ncbi:MAG: hypothetical protein ACTTJ7_09030 [Treponema sp.]
MEPVQNSFIKVTQSPSDELTSKQKVLLNRRGNELFNAGQVLDAQRIFIATGYSDGLTRVGDYYHAHQQRLEALRFYCMAKNKRKSEPLLTSLVDLVRTFLADRV